MMLAMPTLENLTNKTSASAIQLLQCMANFFPNAMSEQAKKQIASCIHSGDAQVRDEAANFLLSVCSDFDDAKSLLEVQKAPKSAKDHQDADGDDTMGEFTINFVSEPQKSRKQLKKLI